MKKFIVTSFILMAAFTTVNAQSERFVNAMKNNIAALDSSFRNPPSLLTLANSFERIGNAEKNQWLPFYYAAFCQVNYSFMESDKSKIDVLADKAAELIAKADSLMPNNSEISCVKSMIASSRMMVNPMQRYMEYGPVSEKCLADAIAQDPTNPRPHYLKGQGLKYTPEAFGGGCKTAIVEFQKAIDKYTVFKPASDIAPDWGKEITEKLIAECK
ncbi:MAG: hypothetical protein V9E88_02955 [Ferruginibacter sp.]